MAVWFIGKQGTASHWQFWKFVETGHYLHWMIPLFSWIYNCKLICKKYLHKDRLKPFMLSNRSELISLKDWQELRYVTSTMIKAIFLGISSLVCFITRSHVCLHVSETKSIRVLESGCIFCHLVIFQALACFKRLNCPTPTFFLEVKILFSVFVKH